MKVHVKVSGNNNTPLCKLSIGTKNRHANKSSGVEECNGSFYHMHADEDCIVPSLFMLMKFAINCRPLMVQPNPSMATLQRSYFSAFPSTMKQSNGVTQS
jgi:hypothetical protein